MKLPQPFVVLPIEELAEETEQEIVSKKEAFAEHLLKNPGVPPFQLALLIYPNNTARALRIANEWPEDKDVKAIKQALVDSEGEMSFLPTAAQDAAETLRIARELLLQDAPTSARFFEMYLKQRDRFPKAGAAIQNNNTIVNHVMVIKDHGTDDEWQTKAIEQQARLRDEVVASSGNRN